MVGKREEMTNHTCSRRNNPDETRSDASVSDPHAALAAPDGGWGWVCAVACSMAHFLLSGLARSFGVIYVILRERFSSSAAVTAWIGALYNTVRFCGGPLAAALVARYAFRGVVMAGGALVCAGCIASAYAPNITLLFLSYGVLLGFGASLVFTPGYIVVDQYFDKKKGKAMGLATLGSGLGGTCVPLIVKLLFDTFGYHGAMCVIGALMLNCCVIGALYRPVASTPHKRMQSKKDLTSIKSFTSKNKVLNADNVWDPFKHSNENEMFPSTEASKLNTPKKCENRKYESEKNTKLSNDSRSKRCLCDISLLDPMFISYAIVVMFLSITQQTFNIFIVAIAKERGIEGTKAIYLIGVRGAGDIIGPVLSALWFDLKSVRKCRPYLVCLVLAFGSVCQICIPLTRDYVAMVILSALFGLTVGSAHAQRISVLGDIVDKNQVSKAVGFLIWFQGIGQLFGPAFAGKKERNKKPRGNAKIQRTMMAWVQHITVIMICMRQGFLKDYFGDYGPNFYFSGSGVIAAILMFSLVSYCVCHKVQKVHCQKERVNIK